MKSSDTTAEITKAFVMIQEALPTVTPDAENSHLHNRYATLDAVRCALAPHVKAAGLVVQQFAEGDDGISAKVTTRITHIGSGEFVEAVLCMRPTKADPQGIGSAITYSCRYMLLTMFSLSVVDDDGAEGSVPQKPARNTRAVAEKPPSTEGVDALRQLVGRWTGFGSNQRTELREAFRQITKHLDLPDLTPAALNTTQVSKVTKFLVERIDKGDDFLRFKFKA